MTAKHYRFTVAIEYAGVIEMDDEEDYDEGDVQDAAVDWALDGGYRDRTVIDVEVEAIDNAGN